MGFNSAFKGLIVYDIPSCLELSCECLMCVAMRSSVLTPQTSGQFTLQIATLRRVSYNQIINGPKKVLQL